jgi:hypothetical protein
MSTKGLNEFILPVVCLGVNHGVSFKGLRVCEGTTPSVFTISVRPYYLYCQCPDYLSDSNNTPCSRPALKHIELLILVHFNDT